jgi:hypothetical protein
MTETNVDTAASKGLLAATKPYAEEIAFKSWWHVASTFV